MTLTPNLNY